MRAVYDGTEYRVTRGPSIYTDRAGREDCRVMRAAGRGEGGAVHGDKRFVTVAVFAAEDGAELRSYERLPPELLPGGLLRQWGLVDGGGTDQSRSAPRFQRGDVAQGDVENVVGGLGRPFS